MGDLTDDERAVLECINDVRLPQPMRDAEMGGIIPSLEARGLIELHTYNGISTWEVTRAGIKVLNEKKEN